MENFDQAFSLDYYTFPSPNVAKWAKYSQVGGTSYWPTARLPTLFSTPFMVELTLSGEGCIGLGSAELSPHGYAGNTPHGWLIYSLNGEFSHNDSRTKPYTFSSFKNKKLRFEWDQIGKKGIISFDGNNYDYSFPNLPSQVYFIVSLWENTSFTIHSCQSE